MTLSTLPATMTRRVRAAVNYTAIVTPAVLLSNRAFAAAANTLGTQMQATAADLGTGGGFILELMAYVLGGMAMIAGCYTFWQNQKNPNGQARLGYGVASILVGGALLALPTIASQSSQSISGSTSTNTGTAAQMTFQ